MADQPSHSTYDDLPYPSLPFAQTHPDVLGTLGTLFGLRPAPADRCRVLELGCASGGNLIPLAVAYPGSRFVGIDYSGRQIEQGRQLLRQLGLDNIELRQASILDVDAGYGTFDYVICHGVYSWVPEEVQDGILRVCAGNLNPDGIAYVSYNTLPGWHMRGMIREMMCFHDNWKGKGSPLERVQKARGLLHFLAQASQDQSTPYALLLRQELEMLQNCNDSYLFHEHLEEHNDPLYFIEFNQRLTDHGLRYVAEADFRSMLLADMPPATRHHLTTLASDRVQLEQYLDFLRNRQFRQSLLCHADHQPSYGLTPDRLAPFLIASPLAPVAATPDLASARAEEFESPGGFRLQSPDPLFKAALVRLGEAWPQAVPFEDLCRQARQRLARDREELSSALFRGFAVHGVSLVELWSRPIPCAPLSDRPVASPLARLQARQEPRAVNCRLRVVPLAEFEQQLLPLLDGMRDRAALWDTLLEAFRQRRFNLLHNKLPVRDEQQARPILAELLDQHLPRLARAGLLVA
jgi:methyltransferase-like protein/2-polyprenyl-3-methyl-5-hydroxy-6-metoxy-1,4-benzoquinol methylase